jgi:radical SAM/Cys-rich protein
MRKIIPKTSLKHRGSPLAIANQQVSLLENTHIECRFSDRLAIEDVDTLRANSIQILQVNLGKLCNMTCAHCHVDAGPDRREIMDRQTIEMCLTVLAENPEIATLDLTGGAPEMNPHFRHAVTTARKHGRHVIDRCNLTILIAKGFEYLPAFLAEQNVEVVASLPCYLEKNTDAQRGDGSFQQSITALKKLNELGYGSADPDHMLTLVYNPVGDSLPPDQSSLESAYREHLDQNYGVRFDRLFTITNMPVSRYLEHLVQAGNLDQYMEKLIDAFNPAAIKGLMCRNTLSVGWDGTLYDCDFNQMLELRLQKMAPQHICDFNMAALRDRQIMLGQHCFGCTAGAGSGCQGAITS